MNINTEQYDLFVRDTWFGGEENAQIIATLGVCGESGEFAEKMKKRLRGDEPGPTNHDIKLELGDILFYITKMAETLDCQLSDIIQLNKAKLNSRIERGVQRGSGDAR